MCCNILKICTNLNFALNKIFLMFCKMNMYYDVVIAVPRIASVRRSVK